jgi:DNA repair exonuclease SbcCD ATPase subunit
VYFHLSAARMNTLLLSVTPEENDSSNAIQPLIILWKLIAEDASQHNQQLRPSTSLRRHSGAHMHNQHGIHPHNHHPHPQTIQNGSGNGLGSGTEPEELIAHFLQSLDESKLKAHSQHHLGLGQGLSQDMLTGQYKILLDNMDSSKLYLLQQAYDVLSHFFTLYHAFSQGQSQGGGDSVSVSAHNHITVHSNNMKNINIHNNVDDISCNKVGGRMITDGTPEDMLLDEELFATQTTLSNLQKKLQVMEMMQADHLFHLHHLEQHLLVDDEKITAGVASQSEPGNGDPTQNHHSPTHNNVSPSYEEILQEISCLGIKLSERTQTSFPFGVMLETPYASISTHSNYFPQLYALEQNCLELLENIRSFQTTQQNVNQLQNDVLKKERSLRALIQEKESFQHERHDLIAMTLETQVLREQLSKYAQEENLFKLVEQKNLDLTKRVKELEEQLSTLQNAPPPPNPTNITTNNSNNLSSHANKFKIDLNELGLGVDDGLNSTSNAVSAILSQASTSEADKVHALAAYATQVQVQLSSLSKEKNKLQSHVVYFEQRIKNSLADQMALHNTCHALEEEMALYKSTITKLTRELEDSKIYKYYKEKYDEQMLAYQQEVARYKQELLEARNNELLANKYHSDLIQAERAIEALEHKVSENNIELEKGSIAMAQLESFREQLKSKTKELRDMSLHIHGLETQLRELPYLNTRYQDILSELAGCKSKVEKIPGLLAEIARLRGSARASIKALAEQDKVLHIYKTRVKALEKEVALLKHDNRALQDVENKLKEANQETKRLMTALADAHTSKNKVNAAAAAAVAAASEGAAKEDVSSLSPINKKMQKYVRQSAFFTTTTSAVTGHRDSAIILPNMNAMSPSASAENSNN